MNEISKMLDSEYERTLCEVSLAKSATEEAKWELMKLSELHKQRMNEMKAQTEMTEAELKVRQLKESKKDRIIRIVTDGAAILIPTCVSSYWMAKGLEFESKGTFTSRTHQWLSNHLRLFKK